MYNLNLIKAVNTLDLKNAVSTISTDLVVSKGSVSSYLNGNIKASEKFLEKFANFYDVPLKELKDLEDEKASKLVSTNNLESRGVPYFDIDFTASFLNVENNQQNTPDSYISHPFFKGCDYVVRNSGQSMAKLIAHGDAIGLVKVNNWQDFFPLGEVYAIVTNNGFRMVKIITKGETEDTYTLISKPTESKKEEFPPQQINKNTIIALYKVQASSHLF